MTYPDLSPFDSNHRLLAVGWLEPGCEYRIGTVEPAFVCKLTELLANPWQPAASAGRHDCGFCRLTGGPASFRLMTGTVEVWMGTSNLWLPGVGRLYVAPSLILHYMDAHGYSPPDEFQEAVMACPPMRSMAYLKALKENGPKEVWSRSFHPET